MGVLARDSDTICAISTAPGVGGIAVIRVSGENALDISRKVCPFLTTDPESHRIYYGFARDASSGDEIDEVLVAYFSEGRSFTGEQTLEISCHGGTIVTADILQALLQAGARLANKGEFTYRAFLNGRIDLIQAESVLGLIEAKSKRASRQSLRQLKGDLSKFTRELEDGLHWVLAHLEANIDFAYEDIEAASNDVLIERLEPLVGGAERAVESYESGRLIHEGIQIAIVGRPNAGKSSLMNGLMGEDRSIVTEFPGTTRDQVEGSIVINGIHITMVDTAGLRDTVDPVELLGIERTHRALQSADFVWVIVDLSIQPDFNEVEVLKVLSSERVWIVGNKSDRLAEGASLEFMANWWKSINALGGMNWKHDPLLVAGNTLDKEGLSEIFLRLEKMTQVESVESSALISQARHYELFLKIRDGMAEGLKMLRVGESPDLISFELRDALLGMHEILGKQFDDEVLDRVFKEFCLGK